MIDASMLPPVRERTVGERCYWLVTPLRVPLLGKPYEVFEVKGPGDFAVCDEASGDVWHVHEPTAAGAVTTILPLAPRDAPAPIVTPSVGERWRFVVDGQPDEVVEILEGSGGYTGFVSVTQGVLIIDLEGRPSCGALRTPRPAPAPRPKQHDEISFDEWRRKIGTMRWP